MMAKTKESNAALLQRHYLQAAGIFHAQNQQVFIRAWKMLSRKDIFQFL